MDTTADCYLYAGVRMMDALFRHPLVVEILGVVLTIGLGYFLALLVTQRWEEARQKREEDWHRWRQQRDYQYQALVRFSRLSSEQLTALSHALVSRGKVDENERRQQGLEALARRSDLLGMDAEMLGFFDDGGQLLRELVGLKDIIRELHTMAFSATPVLEAEYLPAQRRFTQHRRTMITFILAHMEVIRPEERTAILATLGTPE